MEPKIITTKDGSHSIYLPHLDEHYHSVHGSIQESEHVFIKNGLCSYAREHNVNSIIKIFEVGLGTGLNALLTYLWAKGNNFLIDYFSIEAFPLDIKVIEKLNYPQLLGKKEALPCFNKIHQNMCDEMTTLDDCFNLLKINQDIFTYTFPENYFDILYYDAFGPRAQPEMWEFDILKKVTQSLRQNGRFVTYCAQGKLKRNLRSLDLEVITLEGPPGKREMIVGIKK